MFLGRGSRIRARGRARKEPFGQLVNLFQPPFKVTAQRGDIHIHHRGQPVEPLFRLGQRMGLRVTDHLDSVFHGTMRAVVTAQRLGHL